MKKEYMFVELAEYLKREHAIANSLLEPTCHCCPHPSNDRYGARIEAIEDFWAEFPILREAVDA
jgi:hypothetical protein